MAEAPDLFAAVNRPKDPKNMTDLEKKHTPVITAPDQVKAGQCFEVTVEVGKLLKHPNDLDHFIQLIDLYAGEVYLARLDLTAVRTCPVMKVCVQLQKNVGPLRAFEQCNIHGTWEATRPIKVV
jgi:superoxide reductase